jgi:hypothetical protein
MSLPSRDDRPHSFSRNLFAVAVASATFGFGYLNFDPDTVGSAPGARRVSGNALMADMVPMPAMTEMPVESGETVEQAVKEVNPRVLTGRWALRLTSEMLKQGCASFEKIEDYTASMYKQERIGGVLSDGQEIELKVKHAPFSVYMKWLSGDRGRQLIYVDGKNDGDLLVQLGGIAGRLAGLRPLDPESPLAMAESRYPVTKAGLVALAKTILEHQVIDLQRGTGYRCHLEEGHTFDNRPCYLYICEYESPEINKTYRKSVILIDQELSLPVCVKNYTWGRDIEPEKLDESTLLEYYSYSNLKVQQQLPETEFAQDNPEYKLRYRR